MLSWIAYSIGMGLVGVLLALLWMVFLGNPSKTDQRPVATFFKGIVVALAAPFLWCEGITARYIDEIRPVVKEAFYDVDVDGPVRYVKLVTYGRGAARVLVVGEEIDRGFTDRPVVQMDLIQTTNGWQVKDSKILTSNRLNRDVIVFPPYG